MPILPPEKDPTDNGSLDDRYLCTNCKRPVQGNVMLCDDCADSMEL